MGLFAIRGKTRTDSIAVVTQLIEIKNWESLIYCEELMTYMRDFPSFTRTGTATLRGEELYVWLDELFDVLLLWLTLPVVEFCGGVGEASLIAFSFAWRLHL
jgi:hypothetical protein